MDTRSPPLTACMFGITCAVVLNVLAACTCSMFEKHVVFSFFFCFVSFLNAVHAFVLEHYCMLIIGCGCSTVTHSWQRMTLILHINRFVVHTHLCCVIARPNIVHFSIFARIWKHTKNFSSSWASSNPIETFYTIPLPMYRIDTVCTSPRRTVFLAALLVAKRAGNVCISADAKPTRAWAAGGWKQRCGLWMDSWECESHHIAAQVHSASQTNISSKQTLKHMVCLLLFHTCVHAFTERSHFV